jgi:hypothetical protein
MIKVSTCGVRLAHSSARNLHAEHVLVDVVFDIEWLHSWWGQPCSPVCEAAVSPHMTIEPRMYGRSTSGNEKSPRLPHCSACFAIASNTFTCTVHTQKSAICACVLPVGPSQMTLQRGCPTSFSMFARATPKQAYHMTLYMPTSSGCISRLQVSRSV